MNATEIAPKMHPFESAGLGQAPFRFVGMTENVFVVGDGTTKAGGCCDYCSTGIRFEFHVESHDGKRFKVGCDCIRKTSSEKNRLLTDAERAKATFVRKQKEAARQEAWNRKQEALAAAIQAERDANGGKTNAEIAAEKAAAELAERRQKFAMENLWLIQVLASQITPNGDFLRSMIVELSEKPVSGLRGRALEIVRDVYCKSFGRRGSKAYDAANVTFNATAGIESD